MLATRAHEELVAAGARPRRERLSGSEALTPRERQVAQLAARGVRNREIAQRLFITQKTVEWHLGNAFRKLELHSRDSLIGALGDDAEAEGLGAQADGRARRARRHSPPRFRSSTGRPRTHRGPRRHGVSARRGPRPSRAQTPRGPAEAGPLGAWLGSSVYRTSDTRA